MSGLLDFLQGASNSASGTVTAPVDGLAWLLRKAGVPVPSAPVGGSDWMRQKGLLADPQDRTMGLLGESVGGVLPMLAAAKAPQIARGLLQMGENAAAPSTLQHAGQRGAVYLANGELTSNLDDAQRFAAEVRKLGPQYAPVIEEASGGSVYVTVRKAPLTKAGSVAKNRAPYSTGFKARFADHPSYWGSSISSDPTTGNTVADVLRRFEINQGAPPRIGDVLTSSWFDPSIRRGMVQTERFEDAVSRRGNPIQKWVSEPEVPFSFLP